MEKQILQNESPEDRRRLLAANAWKVETKFSYHRELDTSELEDRKDKLSQNMIKIDRADQVLKEHKLTHKTETDPLKTENQKALQEIRTRSEEIVGEVYLWKDEHEQRMGFYSPEGVLISERSLLPEERQYNIEDTIKIAR